MKISLASSFAFDTKIVTVSCLTFANDIFPLPLASKLAEANGGTDSMFAFLNDSIKLTFKIIHDIQQNFLLNWILSVCAPPPPPSLADAHAIFSYDDLPCNDPFSVAGGKITYWGDTNGKDPLNFIRLFLLISQCQVQVTSKQ